MILNKNKTKRRISPNSDYNDPDSENVSQKLNRAKSNTHPSKNIFRKTTGKYSLRSEAGRKNILLMCLISMVLVSNFNQHRGQLRGQLKTDLDQILNENSTEIKEMLEDIGVDSELKIGINDLNPSYLDIDRGRGQSVVKMNGLVPFVAQNLPFSEGQEDTLYEYCLKYANVNITKRCRCEAEPENEEDSVLRKRPMSRHSRNRRRKSVRLGHRGKFSKYYEDLDSDDDNATELPNHSSFVSKLPQLAHKPENARWMKKVKSENNMPFLGETIEAPRPLTYKGQANQDLQELISDTEDPNAPALLPLSDPKNIIEFLGPLKNPIPTPEFNLTRSDKNDLIRHHFVKKISNAESCATRSHEASPKSLNSKKNQKNSSLLHSLLKEEISEENSQTCLPSKTNVQENENKNILKNNVDEMRFKEVGDPGFDSLKGYDLS